MPMLWFWLILAAVMLVIEIMTTALVSLWFVAGALCAACAAALFLPLWLQILVFALVSGVLFFFCRGWLLKHFHSQKLPSNTERLLQETGVVTVAITPDQGGRVRVLSQDWKAVALGDRVVEAGTKVRVVGIQGVKLEVVPEIQPQVLNQTTAH